MEDKSESDLESWRRGGWGGGAAAVRRSCSGGDPAETPGAMGEAQKARGRVPDSREPRESPWRQRCLLEALPVYAGDLSQGRGQSWYSGARAVVTCWWRWAQSPSVCTACSAGLPWPPQGGIPGGRGPVQPTVWTGNTCWARLGHQPGGLCRQQLRNKPGQRC